MKRLLTAILLVSIGTHAEEAAQVQEPEAAKVEENAGHTNWPSLNELWNETETGDGIKGALVNGTPSAELLLSYEYSDLDGNGSKAANALISRIRLNYQAGEYKGFSGFAQAQYVGPLNDLYSYPGGGNDSYDVVNDQEAFRFHQAYLSYAGYDSKARFGSQEIILDNARLIGNVGWRLNAQSFNAISVANQSINDLTLYYAYADSINGIDGDISHSREYHMINGEYKLNESNQVSAFSYMQRNDSARDVDTFGARLWGKNDMLTHDVMLATQSDAYYAHVFGKVDADILGIGAGVEYLTGGSSERDQFQTLNGTAHKFNGWADQFLGTGGGLDGGLVDVYAQVSGKAFEKYTMMAVYHYFHTAEKNDLGFDDEYGQEIDGLVKFPVCKNFDLLAKAAYYKKGKSGAGNFTDDETVFWLRGTLRF